ncbi:uncharacterized protein MKK02DRAFT_43966 [Dioszegia hungarica]|uniref:Protein CPL1-like domain-containing protein n=1 Tax=Dioszegia hungarica TaxID=4972 RepID=A0AA38H9F8_9TREE|nr:uncharacterized protein MKK02DRAFT_43966 [Dioszegia hungarica]KAI9635284.1 hypothetical protein MKK02DRAFT_43966 [Dioszegia hungarica]
MKYSTASAAAVLSFLIPSVLGSSAAAPALRRTPTPVTRDIDVDVNVGVCVRLNAAFDFSASIGGLGAGATAAAQACLCVDTNVGVGIGSGGIGANADVDVYVQLGAGAAVVVGDDAKKIKRAINGNAGNNNPFRNLNFGGACNIPSSLFPNSVHDFTSGCCGRRCNPGFIYNPGNFIHGPSCDACPANKPQTHTLPSGSTICVAACPAPKVRQPDGSCALPACPPTQTRPTPDGDCGCTDAEILCGGICKPKATFTCQSGVPVPKTRKRSRYECQAGKTYCPSVTGLGWECVDTMNDIESCGGCADLSIPFGPGVGQDCTAIVGTDSVTCNRGECKIQSCQAGWAFAQDGKACAPLPPSPASKKNKTNQQLVIMRSS